MQQAAGAISRSISRQSVSNRDTAEISQRYHLLQSPSNTQLYTKLQSDCSGLPISKCSPASFIQGRICPQWLISKGDRQMLQRSNFKIRLLVGCDGLEWDTSRFRGGERSPTCKLCALLRTRCTSYWSAQLSGQSTTEMLLSGGFPHTVCLHLLPKPANKLR